MITKALGSVLAVSAVLALSGLAFGAVYFAALRRSAARLAGDGEALRAAGTALGRIVVAAIFFAAAARFGALPLLAALLGFLIARTLFVRVARMERRLEAPSP